ncbi:MAG: alpha/beta fold hydrolase [Rhodospirillales bacterium]
MFILVHGAYHSAWCWQPLITRLQAAGHKTVAPDLPGHGHIDDWIGDQDMTQYTDAIVKALDAAASPITLVGHSMSGAVVAAAAEKRPDRVDHLVFLAAYIPVDGECVGDVVKADPASHVQASRIDVGGISAIALKTGSLNNAFYNDADAEQLAWVEDRVQLQSATPFRTPIRLSAGNFGRIGKTAIICLKDRAISPPHQRWMAERAGCHAIVDLDSGHSPFVTAPDQLCDTLTRLDFID